jgi:hypothetical protein
VVLISDDVRDPILDSCKKINPYRESKNIFLSRLRWDMRPEAWRSRRKLIAMHNMHVGQKAVIVCNGPSLLTTDFGLLSGVFTFGLNKINLLFDKSTFRPSCIVAVNPFVIEQNAVFFDKTEMPIYMDSKGIRLVRPRSNISFLHSTSSAGFARNCSMSIYQGHTVTYVAMQLAYHMGFTEVALIGCDHNFAVDGPANATVVAGEKDESHFDPNYFAGGVKWQLPDLFESEVAYARAKNIYEAHGRTLINATEGGKLDVLDRRSLTEFIDL